MVSWISRLRSGIELFRTPTSTTAQPVITKADIEHQKAVITALKAEIKTLWTTIEDLEHQMNAFRAEDARKIFRPLGRQYDQIVLAKKLDPLRIQQAELIRAVTHYQETLAEAEAWLTNVLSTEL